MIYRRGSIWRFVASSSYRTALKPSIKNLTEKHGVGNCALGIVGTFSSKDGNAKDDVNLQINL